MIAICPNPYRDIDLELTRKAEKLLTSAGYDCVIFRVFEDSEPKLETIAGELELAVVIGGDGTILNVARRLIDFSVPLLGINLGTKGFMASVEPEDLELILKAAAGDYKPSPRMLLDVTLEREGEIILRSSCLNDTVLHGCGETIKLTASTGDSKIISFSGDGIILSTPTGSTGYSMSAGGPIVEPEAEALIISPICAHSLAARSYVLSALHPVTVECSGLSGRRAYLSIDGNNYDDLKDGDRLTVKKSEKSICMVSIGSKSFFETVFEKLM